MRYLVRLNDQAAKDLADTVLCILVWTLGALSPLGHKPFNMLGPYHFAVPEEVLRGELRPLPNTHYQLVKFASLQLGILTVKHFSIYAEPKPHHGS
jgi:hypothetical protein